LLNGNKSYSVVNRPILYASCFGVARKSDLGYIIFSAKQGQNSRKEGKIVIDLRVSKLGGAVGRLPLYRRRDFTERI